MPKQNITAPFAEIAVAMTVALGKMRLDLAHTMIVARSVGVSNMGLEVVAAERERDIALIEQSLLLFKEMAEIEPQVRALIDRRKRRSWLPSFAKVAAV